MIAATKTDQEGPNGEEILTLEEYLSMTAGWQFQDGCADFTKEYEQHQNTLVDSLVKNSLDILEAKRRMVYRLLDVDDTTPSDLRKIVNRIPGFDMRLIANVPQQLIRTGIMYPTRNVTRRYGDDPAHEWNKYVWILWSREKAEHLLGASAAIEKGLKAFAANSVQVNELLMVVAANEIAEIKI